MGEWPVKTLGDLVTLQRGIDLPAAKRAEGKVPIMGSFGITGYHDEAALSGPGVTVGRSGASIGTVSYIERDYWPLNTCLYVKDFHGNNPRFTYYLLGTTNLANYNSGSAQPSLNRNYIHPIPLAFPSRAEQDHIASLLGALDDKIELNRRMNETLEAMARAIFKDWFVDFGPTRAKAEGRPAYLAPDLWSLFPDALDQEDKPVGWETSLLVDRIEVLDSKRIPLSSRERERRQGTYPYHGATGVMDHVDDFLFEGVHILLGEDGSVVKPDGKPFTQYVWGQFWVNNHAHVLRGCGISNEILLCFLQQIDIAPYVTGAVQPKLNQRNLKAIPFPASSARVTKAFEKAVGPLFEQFRLNADHTRTLAQTRDLLLPKLMSGEIRLRDAEKAVEAVA